MSGDEGIWFWMLVGALAIIAWAVSSYLFFLFIRLPYFCAQIVYRIRFSKIDEFYKQMKKEAFDFCQQLSLDHGDRDGARAVHALEKGSDVKLLFGVSTLVYFMLYVSGRRRLADHYSELFFWDDDPKFREGWCFMAECVKTVASRYTGEKIAEWHDICEEVCLQWTSRYKSLPGLGLITIFDFLALLGSVKDCCKAYGIGITDGTVSFSDYDITFFLRRFDLCRGVSEMVGGRHPWRDRWHNYLDFANRLRTT